MSVKRYAAFSSSRIKQLLHDAGAEKVDLYAITQLNKVITDVGRTIAKAAIDDCRHAGRVIVLERDIIIAERREYPFGALQNPFAKNQSSNKSNDFNPREYYEEFTNR